MEISKNHPVCKVMITKNNIKSVIGGLCIGLLGALVLGAAGHPASAPIGRYQITGSAALFMVLDTSTGQVWCGDFHSSLDGRVPNNPLAIPAARDEFFGPKLATTSY